jgi:hypothetical protein
MATPCHMPMALMVDRDGDDCQQADGRPQADGLRQSYYPFGYPMPYAPDSAGESREKEGKLEVKALMVIGSLFGHSYLQFSCS